MVPRICSVVVLSALCLAPGTALAEEVLVQTGSPVLSNGQPVAIQLHHPAFGPDSRVKVTVAGEKVEALDLSEPGLLQLTVAPPADDRAGALVLSIKAKGEAGKLDTTVEVPVQAAGTTPLEIAFEPALFAYGSDETVKVTLTPPPGEQALDQRSFSVHSSSGVIDTLTPIGDGRFVARWTPPRSLEGSQVVLFMVSEDNRSGEVFGAAALPVMATSEVRLSVAPGSTNTLETGQRKHGPLKADAEGTVVFRVAVDPRAPTGTLTTVTGEGKTTESVDLPVAEGTRVTFNPPPPGLPADPFTPFDVVVYALAADGSSLDAVPSVSADRGVMGTPVPGPVRGTFLAPFTPPSDAGKVVFTASAGEEPVERSTTVVPAPSAPLATLTAEEDGGTISLTARLKTPEGRSLVGQPPLVRVDGGRLQGKPKDNGDGTYSFVARRTEQRFLATLTSPLPPTGLPPAGLQAWVADPALAPGEGTALLVAVTDPFGHGVPDVPVSLTCTGADLPPEVRTDERGLVSLPLIPTASGRQTVGVSAAGFSREVVVLEEPPERDALPLAGSEAHRAALAGWQGRTAGLYLPEPEPEPVPVPVVAAAPVAAASAPPSAGSVAASAAATPSTAAAPAPVAPPASPEPGPAAAPSVPAAEGTPSAPTVVRAAGRVKARAPRAPKAPASPSSSGGLSLRLSAALAGGRHSYAATPESTASPAVPTLTTFSTGGLLSAPGAQVRASAFFGGEFGADVRLRYWGERLDLREEEVVSSSVGFLAAGQYRYPLNDLVKPFVTLGVHQVTTPSFTYTNADQTGLNATREFFLGARIAVGSEITSGPVFGRVEFGETFAPNPSVHQLDGEVGYEVMDGVAVRLGVQQEWRNLRMEVGAYDVEAKDQLTTVSLGATWVLD